MKATDLAKVRATLWAAADELRANSDDVVVRIHADPAFAARVAAELGTDHDA